MVPCEELVLLGGSVEVLGQPIYGLEAQPKFVQLQAHILKISMVCRTSQVVTLGYAPVSSNQGNLCVHFPDEWSLLGILFSRSFLSA